MVQRIHTLLMICLIGLLPGPAGAAEEKLPDDGLIMQALADELQRSLTVQMEDLEKPYFIQFNVDDQVAYQLSAAFGAMTGSDRDRSRRFVSRVRVGSSELDNTNFVESGGGRGGGRSGGGGAQTALVLDADYAALRHAIWRTVDEDYKNAVETLTRKRAYLRDKNIADRAQDFSPADPVELLEPSAVMAFAPQQWEEYLKTVSGHFKKYPQVQDSSVRLLVATGNSYVVTSEGTRLRHPDTGALLVITAEVQAEDGMRISDNRSYVGFSTQDLPPVARLIQDVEALVADLTAIAAAPVLEHYTGPVLFEDAASGQVFRSLLAEGLAGQPDMVGEQRTRPGAAESLETKLGTRVLPKSFQVWDDPTTERVGDQALLGHYRFDEEGVAAARVELVSKGMLKDLCRSRAPTKKLTGSNGHARRAVGGSNPQAAIGCLFIEDESGVPAKELRAALIQAARDAGLEYGLVVRSIKLAGLTASRSDLMAMVMRAQQRPGGNLGDPVLIHKVYVADGREEPVRGCEFGPADVSVLRKIIASGDTPVVYSYIGRGLTGATPPSSIIAPSILVEELDLTKIRQEFDKPPILPAPLARKPGK